MVVTLGTDTLDLPTVQMRAAEIKRGSDNFEDHPTTLTEKKLIVYTTW